MCYRLVGTHHFNCIYWCVGHLALKLVVFCRVGNPYVGVSEEFGDYASFPVGIHKFCPFCGCYLPGSVVSCYV
jgi:hypothetical protein